MSTPAAFNSSDSSSTLFVGIWDHLSPRRRIQLGLLLLVMLGSGGAELVSLGAVLPLLVALSEPEGLWQKSWVQSIAAQLGWTQSNDLLIPVTLCFVIAAVMAALIRLTNLWLNVRLAAAVGSDLSCEAYRRTLYQPYGIHVQRNTATVITGITAHIEKTCLAISSLLQLFTSAVVASSLLIGLLLIDAQVALAAALIFGFAYSILAVTAKQELRRNGQKIVNASSQRLKVLQEGLSAVRDILLDTSQPAYVKIYQQADRPQRQLQAKNVFLGAYPRFALEALGMVSIALLGGFLVLQRGSGAAVIPLLGVLALGAQRLLPALQQIYSGWATLKSCNAAMQAVLEILNQTIPQIVSVDEPLLLSQSIRFERVHFRYNAKKPEIIRGLDLEIRRGERIGLIGSTGSGKSTTIDLLMGLLEPTAGRLLVDDIDLYNKNCPERLLAWRASIAHVPQSIYLFDGSIAENIAFGVPREKIDISRVRLAAEKAQIASFIESSNEGYESFVGERGIRLSGGQRQRIGIARALYKSSTVLVLDEATSALDTQTEKALMSAINELSKDLTIVMIAHRLSTLKYCDRVIRLSAGVASADGSHDEIISAHS